MKVKLLASMAGVNFSHSIGDVVDLEAEEAGRMIRAGFAVPEVPDVTETRKSKRD